MKNICILLTDNESISEKIIINSLKYINKSLIKKCVFIGDKKLFKFLYKKILKNKKYSFLHSEYSKKNPFVYLNKITDIALKLLKEKKINLLINMPLTKKKFFSKGQFEGYTEFFSAKNKTSGKENMILFSNSFSVCPITTHILVKEVSKRITQKKVVHTLKNIFLFCKKYLKKKNTIKVLSLNPHGEVDFPNQEEKVIKKSINQYNKVFKDKVIGPISADTAFINKEDRKNSIFVGMYHDQVLTPFKIINNFKGINITIGTKYLRISPDHGVAKNLRKKSKINNQSFIECIKFSEKYL